MDPHTYTVRCYTCGEALTVIDRYPPVAVNGRGEPLAEQPRPYDPDWVLERHHRRTH